MANATSVLTVENKKEIAKKIGTLNKIQTALAQNPALTLDQMLLNTQITPEVRAAYEKLIMQARCLIAGTMHYPMVDKDTVFRSLAEESCFKSHMDLLLLSYALELRLNGFKPITPAVQKEAENRFISYCDTSSILAETPVNDIFASEEIPSPVAAPIHQTVQTPPVVEPVSVVPFTAPVQQSPIVQPTQMPQQQMVQPAQPVQPVVQQNPMQPQVPISQPVQPVQPIQPSPVQTPQSQMSVQPVQPVQPVSVAIPIEPLPSASESLSNNTERDVLKRELMKRTRALIKLNETNRVVEMNGHKVPYPILNPYFDAEGHLNIGFTDLTNNAYLLDDLKIHRNQTEVLSDTEKESLMIDWEDRYEEMGRPTMQPDNFATLDGFREYSVPPDNASQVADLQISDDVDDLMQDLETADLSMIPFPFLQVALDIIYETGYALTETNPAFYQALLTGGYETLTDEDYVPRLDDVVWNNVARTKRRRTLIQMGLQEWQRNNARPMGGAGKVPSLSENIQQNQPVEAQKQ